MPHPRIPRIEQASGKGQKTTTYFVSGHPSPRSAEYLMDGDESRFLASRLSGIKRCKRKRGRARPGCAGTACSACISAPQGRSRSAVSEEPAPLFFWGGAEDTASPARARGAASGSILPSLAPSIMRRASLRAGCSSRMGSACVHPIELPCRRYWIPGRCAVPCRPTRRPGPFS